ncbi:branched-chain amino acid aminotransferase [Aestuariivirga litoralis]|uniref:branched-chain amino acid aminotransferase n=1 Tax=Aestuariivirga litoralis TaxID=2650924 RepID=UPI0018C71736|nr:branched-chain amino acid aminotransferase [Aestuariivirga litoralis]MBG1233866.1 branched-chain amino acid aminotransferase [Aestuariivirga litoralis]
MSHGHHASAITKTWTYFEGQWQEGNVKILGVRSHAAWLGSTIFDGARAFEGVTPDLDLHLARVNRSAENFQLKAKVPHQQWMDLAADGIAKFGTKPELYIRPMYWAEAGMAGGGVRYDPESTNWALCIHEAPMTKPTGASVTLSPFRRPTAENAPVDAKAGCLYPNNARAIIEAEQRGFSNCLLRDMLGNVAETANSNVFMVKDGVVYTPAANGTFLAGITCSRMIGLLRDAGYEVKEDMLRYKAFQDADELFTCGNFAKVSPITRIDERELQPGPVYTKARELYWKFAHKG